MGRKRRQAYPYAIVLDFEATCDNINPPNPQEVIEFPSVLVDMETLSPIDEFSSFVRPVHHPEITDFCTELTSIVQDDVDPAPVFAEVLEQHMAWLDGHGVNADNGLLVTCGDWDMQRMFPAQFRVAEPEVKALRPIYTRWLNIKTMYCDVTNKRKAPGMAGMLRQMSLTLEGRHHRGIDDCRNIAKLLDVLMQRGGRFEPSGHLRKKKFPPVRVRIRHEDEVKEAVLSHRNVDTLHNLARNLYKQSVAGCRLPNGQVLSETEDLLWLEAGQEIVVTLKEG